MLGVAHLFERQNAEAAEEFRKLLQLRPDYRMDAPAGSAAWWWTSSTACSKEQEAELAELERKRRSRPRTDERRRLDALRAGPDRSWSATTTATRLLVSFVPFGAGQFQNGQRTKGWFFLGSRGRPGRGLGGGAGHQLRPVRRPARPCSCEPSPEAAAGACPDGIQGVPERARSELLKKVQLVSGVLFFATAIWGVDGRCPQFPAPRC